MAGETSTEVEPNKELVKEFMKRFSDGDFDRAVEMMVDSATWWTAGSLPFSGTLSKGALGEALRSMSASFKGPIRLTPKTFTAEGQRVAVEAQADAELLDGRRYATLYPMLFVIREGKIHEVKEYLDTLYVKELFFSS